MVLYGKSSQEYPVNACAPQGSILGLTLFLLHISGLTDDVVILLSMPMILISTLSVIKYLICRVGFLTYEIQWTGAGSGLLWKWKRLVQ